MQSEPVHRNQSRKSSIPTLYHAHHKEFQTDISFWLDLARYQGNPILELGCGTGRVLIPLAQSDHTVYGLDIDDGMLDFCHQQVVQEIKPRVHLLQADLTKFHFGIRFPLILLPCNTFSTLDGSQQKSALAYIFKHLTRGGLFAVSIPNPSLISQLETTDSPEIEHSFDHPLTGNPVQVSYGIQRTERTVMLEWFYDHLLPDGHVERFDIRARHLLKPAAEYIRDFKLAGYDIAATYGDFDYSDHKPKSPNLIILAKKPE